MKQYPFDYNIFPNNSPEMFKDMCRKIEEHFPDAEKKKLLVDVDGTTVQSYMETGREIAVFDDYDIGAVFVQSEIDLKEIMA